MHDTQKSRFLILVEILQKFHFNLDQQQNQKTRQKGNAREDNPKIRKADF